MKRRGVLKTAALLLRIVVGGFIAVSILIFSMILTGESGSPPPGGRADCALVFGSAVYGWNTPGPSMKRRVSTVARLYQQGDIRRIVFTGGRTASTDQTEAEVMKQQSLELGIPASVITMENEAQSTWQNLEFSRPLLAGCSSVVAVSDGFHLARIRFSARLQGWGSLPTIPADEPPPSDMHIKSIFREYAAFIYYALLGPWLNDPALPTSQALHPAYVLT